MMKTLQLILFSAIVFFLFARPTCKNTSTWKPNAGVVSPYSAVVTVSSGNEAALVNDQNYNTFWQSDAPLPNNFMRRTDQNMLLNTSGNQIKSAPQNNKQDDKLTDGDLNSSTLLPAYTRIELGKKSSFLSISLKLSTTNPVQVYAIRTPTDSVLLGTYANADNFQLVRYRHILLEVSAFSLVSTSEYTAFEIAALADFPAEYVILDLEEQRQIGAVMTKHFCENMAKTELWVSSDKINWQKAADLDAKATPFMSVALPDTMPKRYLKAIQYVNDVDWNKASWWELSVYDQYGAYGKPPAPKPSPTTLAEQIGINGIWGWGHNKYVDELPPTVGVGLFNQTCQNVRNYHPLDWDVTDPDHIPNYTVMSNGGGTEAQPWHNWDREYGAWKEKGMTTGVTIKFDDGALQPMSVWDNPYQAAFNYGNAFGQHFGESGKNLISYLEVGNEPWQYPADFYNQLLRGMSRGVKSTAPNMLVFPCALQSGFPINEVMGDFKNYSGARISAEDTAFIDGLNVHVYSYAHRPNGQRIATNPENPLSEMRGILNDIAFRDANMPRKKIYVTEWGWDSSGGGEDCLHSECVSEAAQAAYLVRGALWMSRIGIDKSFWYFYANTNHTASSVFTNSGLVASPNGNFTPKLSFYALKNLKEKLGNTHFLAVVREDQLAYVYAFGTASGEITHLVAWRPVPITDNTTESSTPSPPLSVKAAWGNDMPTNAYLIGQSQALIPAMDRVSRNGLQLNLQLSAFPLIVEL